MIDEKNTTPENEVERTEQTEKKSGTATEIISWVLTFLCAVVVALFLKNYIIINATVPTGSMENTILPGDDLLGFRLAYSHSDPKRGDIVIFAFPDDESKKYVKRVIGLPGETVEITEGKVYIDGSETPLEEPYLKEQWLVATGPFKFEVPKNSYLVLGDNRNDSYDSRYWTNTFVKKDKIIGKVLFIYYPFNRIQSVK